MPDITLDTEHSLEELLLENAFLKKALEAAELRYSQLTTQLSKASSFNDGVWDWDLTTDNVYLSPRWKEMLGYHKNELPNAFSTWTDLIHPDDLESALDVVHKFIESDDLFYENIHRLKHKNGEWRWILDRGVAIRDDNNKLTRLSGSHTDITLLCKTEEALLQRERKLSNIVTVSPDGIVTFTTDNLVSSVNPSFLDMTGFTQDELLFMDKNQFDQKMIAISDVRKPYQANIENHESLLIQLLPIDKKDLSLPNEKSNDHVQLNIKNKPLSNRVLSVTKYCLNNTITPTIMYFRDVTLETEINRAKSEFLSVASHELRTPISSIYGYSELLIHRDFDEVTKRDILQVIHKQCTNVVDMINDLLILARMETRSQQFFNFKLQPFVRVIRETINDFRMPDDVRDIDMQCFVDEFSLINMDREQIKRALINVLSNAFKYSKPGSRITLEVLHRTNLSGFVEIGVTVQDKGIGMTPFQINRIFDKFWRADNVREIIGTGLGMALVKEIIDLHNGEIEVQSSLGQGTKIGLWLPLNQSENQE